MTTVLPTGRIVLTLLIAAALVVLLWASAWRLIWLADSPQGVRPARAGLRGVLLAAAVCIALFGGLAVLLQIGLTEQLDLVVDASFAPYRAPWLLAAFVGSHR